MGNIKNANKYSSDEFVKRFSSLIAESGKNGIEVAEMLGASPAAVATWRQGKALPGADALRRIALAFNVTADYLLGISENKADAAQIVHDYTGLSAEAAVTLHDVNVIRNGLPHKVYMTFFSELITSKEFYTAFMALVKKDIEYKEFVRNYPVEKVRAELGDTFDSREIEQIKEIAKDKKELELSEYFVERAIREVLLNRRSYSIVRADGYAELIWRTAFDETVEKKMSKEE